MLFRSDFRKLFQRSGAELRLLAEAAAQLALMRLAVSTVSFQRTSRWLGLAAGPGRSQVEPQQQALAAVIGWSVVRASSRVPTVFTCLVQAFAASRMLSRRGIPHRVCLGVALAGPVRSLEAHAWLMCGAETLTGGGVRDRFTPLAEFHWP